MNEHDNLKVFDVIIPNIKCGYLTIEQGSTERKLCRIMKQDCSRDICPKPKPDTRPADEVVEALERLLRVASVELTGKRDDVLEQARKALAAVGGE